MTDHWNVTVNCQTVWTNFCCLTRHRLSGVTFLCGFYCTLTKTLRDIRFQRSNYALICFTVLKYKLVLLWMLHMYININVLLISSNKYAISSFSECIFKSRYSLMGLMSCLTSFKYFVSKLVKCVPIQTCC